jgi:hypothetical protein
VEAVVDEVLEGDPIIRRKQCVFFRAVVAAAILYQLKAYTFSLKEENSSIKVVSDNPNLFLSV